ncbi:hypothetical protein HMPREF0555_0500 [Leuconostoc mesenteroides subsp. cremoris ATCC 19254]|uniref:Uncharacterized protein n=1 Tax=Leuconostoc mesenteroides subsp. cremoris ATCC 19254 TaxID=586220 RepID=C2KIN4_LEUMC|nr:hypothetical protein HMPREF0555_0500 [Leuconostoc mesenteroides subsp. cremoris ATCC 19254]
MLLIILFFKTQYIKVLSIMKILFLKLNKNDSGKFIKSRFSILNTYLTSY